MRRLPTALALFTVLPTAVVALPVASRLHPGPRPVAPVVRTLSAHVASDGSEVVEASGQEFTLVGARWDAGTLRQGVRIEMRSHGGSGWSAWTPLTPTDVAADDDSADASAARRNVGASQVADPVWVGTADGVQVRAVGPNAVRKPGHLRAVLVDGGRSPADTSVGAPATLGGGVAQAAVTQPTIYSRAQWGADESLRLNACPEGPDYGTTVKIGFVHHTDTANDYTSGDVPSIIRSIYAYHVQSNGWCDIGYNFLVDRFGRIWEGRYGGIDRPVIGAHTGGFNTNTFAASLIGNYATTAPSSAMLSAIEHLYAWKLGTNYRSPTGTDTLTAGSFSGSKFATGSTVTFNVISGHRDADYTTCPGDSAYSYLPTIRHATRMLLGAGFVAPTVSPRSRKVGEAGGFTVASGVLTDQPWTLRVVDASGTTVWGASGTASQSAPISVNWPGVNAVGAPVPPGTYTLTATSQNTAGTATAIPWSTTVQITAPVTLSGPPTTGYGSQVRLVGTAAAGSSVVVHLQGSGDPAPTDTTLTVAPDGTFATTYTATRDMVWSATGGGYTTPQGTTRVVPTVSNPALVTVGSQVTGNGTAPPGATVSLYRRALGTSDWGAPVSTLSPDAQGQFAWTWTADRSAQWYAQASGVNSVGVTTVTGTPPSVTGPGRAAYRATVWLSGTGPANVPTDIWIKRATSPDYFRATTVTSGADGRFRWAFALLSTTNWYAVNALGRSRTGGTVVQPVVRGPSSALAPSGVRVYGSAAPNQPVSLYIRRYGTSTWIHARDTAADSAGRFSWSFTLRYAVQVYARSNGVPSVGITIRTR